MWRVPCSYKPRETFYAKVYISRTITVRGCTKLSIFLFGTLGRCPSADETDYREHRERCTIDLSLRRLYSADYGPNDMCPRTTSSSHLPSPPRTHAHGSAPFRTVDRTRSPDFKQRRRSRRCACYGATPQRACECASRDIAVIFLPPRLLALLPFSAQLPVCRRRCG